MTPKRRAALKKAQTASARKRKSKRNKRIGTAAGVAAGVGAIGVLGFLGHKHMKSRSAKGVTPVALSTSKELDIVRHQGRLFTDPEGRLSGKNNWKIAGAPVRRTQVGRRRKHRPNYVQWEKSRITGLARAERKADRQRMRYWQGNIPNKQPAYKGSLRTRARAKYNG